MCDLAEKFFRKKRPALFQKLEIFLFLFHQCKSVFYLLDKIGIIQRLFDIIQSTEEQSASCIFKFIIGTDQDDLHHRIDLKSLTAHGNAVKIRHFNVRNDQICRFFFHGFDSRGSIVADMDDLCIQCFPVYVFFDTFCR